MKESNIQTEIMKEISKTGIPLRLNSGKAWGGEIVKITPQMIGKLAIVNPRPIKLCPEGTADVLAILPEGKVEWVEVKTKKGKQRESQKFFQSEVEKLGHKYIIARSIEEIKNSH